MPGRAPAARRPRRSRTPSRPRRGPASSARTASKPIVVARTRSGSPPAPATTERSTASSDGRPVTPARRPSRSAGVRIPGCASTAASGRWTSAITPTRSRPCWRARPRSWMSRMARSARPRLEQRQRVGRGARLADLQRDALRVVEAARDRGVEAGVDAVGREVEQQRRLGVRPVLAGGRRRSRRRRPPAAPSRTAPARRGEADAGSPS